MNVFRDLLINANAEKMAEVVAEMEKALPAGWVRDKAAEARTQAFPVSTSRVTYCFACKKDNGPAAMLALAQKDPNTFYVSNIIPIEGHQLEQAEYNNILEDFYEKAFKSCADKAKLEYTLTSPDAWLENWMDSETAELLRTFSARANRGTGASHPKHRARWNAFVLSAHRKDCKLDPSTLVRWLVEEENWSPEIAEQLAIEYESGRGILAYALAP